MRLKLLDFVEHCTLINRQNTRLRVPALKSWQLQQAPQRLPLVPVHP